MDPQFEQAVEEGLALAEQCTAKTPVPTRSVTPQAQELARLAMRCLPVVFAVVVAGGDPEIINIVWGVA